MAQVLKEEIKKNIFSVAIEEFFNIGYQSATLRQIAQKSNIPVGLIYTYYQNKAALFEAVVDPTYHALQNVLSTTANPTEYRPGYENFFQTELPFIFTMLKHNRKSFIILIDKSHGTKYENSREELIHLTEIHIQAKLQHKVTKGETIDELFYHILANNFMEGLFEIARHYQNEQWADHIVKLFLQQYFYGINSFLE